MAYKAFWYKENRVVYAELIGDFDAQEMIALNQHIRDEYLEKGEAPVHFICDATSLTGYPRNIKVIQEATQISMKHPAMGWAILVGVDNPLVRYLASIIAQVIGLRFKVAGSLQEAESILEKLEAEQKTTAT